MSALDAVILADPAGPLACLRTPFGDVVSYRCEGTHDVASSVVAAARAISSAEANESLRTLLLVPAPAARAKAVDGLPEVKDDETRNAVVANQLARYFLSRAVDMRAGRPVRDDDGRWWVAMYLWPSVAPAIDAARAVGLDVAGVLALDWCHRAAVGDAALAAGASETLLTQLLDVDVSRAPVMLDEGIGAGGRAGRLAVRRRFWSLGALVAFWLLAFLPLGVAQLSAARARRQLVALGPSRVTVARAVRDIREQRAVESCVAHFLFISPSRLATLAALSEALPDSAAVQSVSMDSAGVDVTLVGVDVGAAVTELQSAPMFSQVRVTSGISTTGSAATMQRVALRLTPASKGIALACDRARGA